MKTPSPTQRTIVSLDGTREVVDFKIKQKMFVHQPLSWKQRFMALLGYDLYIACHNFYQHSPGKVATDWKIVFTDINPQDNPKEWAIQQEKLFPIITQTPESQGNVVPMPRTTA